MPIDSVEYILRDLVPDARVIEDDQTGAITATATATEHEQIAEVLRQLDQPGQNQRTTQIYRFDRTSAQAAETVFERIAPRARVSVISAQTRSSPPPRLQITHSSVKRGEDQR